MAKSIAILVGRAASKIRFNHNITLKRAINADTLKRMVCNVDFAIIESIDSKEEGRIKEIIEEFKRAGKLVYFFPSINDEITLGVADELEYTIYSTLEALCLAIESEQNIKVSTGYTVENDIDSSNDFGQTFEMREALKELVAEDLVKQSQTDNLDKFSGFDSYENSSDASSTADNDITGNNVPEVDAYALQAELSELPESVSNEINRLKMQLSDLNYEYSVAIDDMKVATGRIDNLEKIINTLKDEKECMQTEFKSITETNDVLEDPISLSVYQKTVEELQNRDAQVEELETQVAELKQRVDGDKNTLAEKLNEITELNARLSELEEELEAINLSISSGEIHKDVVAGFTEKLEKLKSERDSAVREANELRIKASSDTSTIGLLNKNLALETQYRYASVELFIELIDKLNTKIGELNTALTEKGGLEDKLSSSEETGSKLTADLEAANTRIRELSEVASKLKDKENELTEKESELEEVRAHLTDTQSKLDEALETLSTKEAEYREALNKYIEDASRVLEDVKHDNEDTVAKLQKELDNLRALDAPKNDKIAEQESKIAKLNQQVDNSNVTIDDLNQTIECLNSVIDAKDAQLDSKDAKLDEQAKLVESLNQTVADKDGTIKDRDYTILQKDRELAVNAESIKALNENIANIEAKHAAEAKEHEDIINDLNGQVDKLNEIIASREYTIGVQGVALDERDADIEQLKADIDAAKKTIALLEDKIKRADERFKSTLEKLKISGGDIEKLMAETSSSLSEAEVAALNEKLEQAETDVENLELELEKLKSDYSDLNTKYTEAVKQLSENTNIISAKTAELSEANILVQQLTSRVEQLENDKSTLESVKNGASSDEVEAIKSQNSTLVEKNSALTAQLNNSLEHEAESKRQISRMESELETYKSLVAELQSGAGSFGGQCAIGNINYNRSAQIISVFGNRSCGITTLAVSIARKLSLNTNVLYIDFDMIAPKGDVIFKKTPVVEIRGAKNTSLGAMTQLSSNLTANEIRSLAIDVEKTKGGNLAYFSGYYWKPNDCVIANTDFQRMFDVLGEYYDYIVVDLGKIGASSFNNSIIKEITSISRKTIAISNNDPFNVKAMLRTLSSMGIDSKSISWAINKVPEVQVGSQNIAVNTKIMEALNGCKVGAFADDPKLRGLPSDFLNCARSNKINFEIFLTQTVFG